MAVVFEWKLRPMLVSVLERAAAGEPVAEEAAELLEELRRIWVRERRWRNDGRPPERILHIAGPAIACRKDTHGRKGFIVDMRQTCQRCGIELARGKWALLWEDGDQVAALGTILNLAKGVPGEVPCC